MPTRKLLLAILLLASVCAWGQGATLVFPHAVNQNGSPLSFATVTFCSTPTTISAAGVCQTPITVYKDEGLTTPYSSAILTDGIGYFPPNVVTTTSLWFTPSASYCFTLTTSNMLSPATNPCTPFSVGATTSTIFPSITVTGNIFGSLNTILCLNSDTGLGRNAPAWWNMGNCTPGDQSGTLSLNTLFDDQNYIAAGTAAAPSRAFKTDSASGMYLVAGGTVGISAGGMASATFDATKTTLFGDEALSSGKVIAWNADTSLSRDGAGVIDIGVGTQGDKTGTVKVQSAIVANFDSVLWVDGIKYTTLAGCYADIPSTGGVCMVPPGYTETLNANLVLSKNGSGFQFTGPAIITMGSNQVTVTAGTTGAFITGPLDGGGHKCVSIPCTTYTNSTEFIYTGNSTAVVVGGNTPQTQRVAIRNIFFNLSGAGNAAIGIDLINVAGHFNISNNVVLGNGAAGNTGTGILTDGGANFTCDGEIDENEVINFLIEIGTANMSCENVYKGNQLTAGAIPGTIFLDFEATNFGNVVLGGNYAGAATTLKVAGTGNDNYFILDVNSETADANFGAGTSNNMVIFLGQAGASQNPPVVTDTGTNNTFWWPGSFKINAAGQIATYNATATAGIGVVPITGYVHLTGQTTALGPTTIVTSAAANTLYVVEGAITCDSSSAAATANVVIKYTDVSNTVITSGTVTATCTTLGSSSGTAIFVAANVKASTAIQYQVTIANTPTYDLRLAVRQMGAN